MTLLVGVIVIYIMMIFFAALIGYPLVLFIGVIAQAVQRRIAAVAQRRLPVDWSSFLSSTLLWLPRPALQSLVSTSSWRMLGCFVIEPLVYGLVVLICNGLLMYLLYTSTAFLQAMQDLGARGYAVACMFLVFLMMYLCCAAAYSILIAAGRWVLWRFFDADAALLRGKQKFLFFVSCAAPLLIVYLGIAVVVLIEWSTLATGLVV